MTVTAAATQRSIQCLPQNPSRGAVYNDGRASLLAEGQASPGWVTSRWGARCAQPGRTDDGGGEGTGRWPVSASQTGQDGPRIPRGAADRTREGVACEGRENSLGLWWVCENLKYQIER